MGIENMPYLGMFGGNIEESTVNKVEKLQSFDWWGNNLINARESKYSI
jgi:hypothetical protein